MPATLFRIPNFSISNQGDVFGFRSGLQRFESSQDLALNQAESVLYGFGFFEPETGQDPMSQNLDPSPDLQLFADSEFGNIRLLYSVRTKFWQDFGTIIPSGARYEFYKSKMRRSF